MSNAERRSCWIGITLLGLTAAFIYHTKTGGQRSTANREQEHPPVEEMAERLKQAWSTHHID
ncbi:MAG TPA: hypothetical protein VLJ11_14320 [Bryobacteraceae bacterium]|nr:hypothetical protein [Bryobacteraceae bacterium]